MANPKIPFDNLIVTKLVLESTSFRQVLLKLRRNESSGSYSSLRRFILANNIDTSHFLSPSEHAHLATQKRVSNTELFNQNDCARSTVKKRIITENLIPYECVFCLNKGEWLGKKIVLILDHINGVRNDNRLENLRFVCPNCNAVLPTHCLGVKGIKVKETKIKKSTPRPMCRKIQNRPTREELLEMIAKTSYSAVGRIFGVSDNAVRKWIKINGSLV